MEGSMNYLLEPRGENSFAIVNENCNFYIGHVYLMNGRYHVWCSVNDDEVEVAVVKSLNDAIPAFAAYYASHPPQWEPTDLAGWVITPPAAHRGTATRYSKLTDFGGLDVMQEQPGQWVAYRNSEFPLLRDGKPAIFATREKAQRAADTHVREGYPNSDRIDDGYEWLVDPGIEAWFAAPERRPNTVNDGAAVAA
jgi:hypothetical protein